MASKKKAKRLKGRTITSGHHQVAVPPDDLFFKKGRHAPCDDKGLYFLQKRRLKPAYIL
jgi:hypothetical protein